METQMRSGAKHIEKTGALWTMLASSLLAVVSFTTPAFSWPLIETIGESAGSWRQTRTTDQDYKPRLQTNTE